MLVSQNPCEPNVKDVREGWLNVGHVDFMLFSLLSFFTLGTHFLVEYGL